MYHNHRGEQLGHINSHSRVVDRLTHHFSQLHHILLHIRIVQQLQDNPTQKDTYSHEFRNLTSLLWLSGLLSGLSLLLSTGLLYTASSANTRRSITFRLLTSEHC